MIGNDEVGPGVMVRAIERLFERIAQKEDIDVTLNVVRQPAPGPQ